MRSMLGNLKLFGFLPPGVKNYNAHLRPVIEQLAKHCPGPGGVPIRVRDGFSGEDIDVYLVLTHNMVPP